MPYKKDNPPDRIKHLPKHAQSIWISAYNSAYDQYGQDEERANKVAWAAVKKVYRKVGDKWVKKASFSFPIDLAEAKIKQKMEIHVIPVGEWKHVLYGDIKITEEDIEEFVQHFDQKVRKGIYITEGHGFGEQPALGWFSKLTNKGKKGLWGTVEWTKKGRELLEEKAYKYFSPEFFSVYEDPETHRFYNNVLTGGALTNSPYFKELKSIVMHEPIILDQFKVIDKNIMSKDNKEVLTEDAVYREPKAKTELAEDDKLIYQVINSGDVKLSDKADLSEFKKELLRVGTWRHRASENGILNVTKEMLQTIVKNFKDKVLDHVFVPLGHPDTDDPSKNTGEVVGLDIEGERLMATVDVKEKSTIQKIKKGLIKSISASIAENYIKKDTGEEVGPTLFHAALVSEPYIKGMAGFVPLSEDMAGSKVVPIINMEKEITMKELSTRVGKMEKVLTQLSEKFKLGESEEETKEEETEEDESKEESTEEETKEVKASEKKTKETSTDETKEEETSDEEETKSSKVGEKAKEEEAEETEEEETESEETEEEVEEKKAEADKVALAEAEGIFNTLLKAGKVVPAQKELLIPLLTSNEKVELSDGKFTTTKAQLIEYLEKQEVKIPLSEKGTTSTSKKKIDKKIEMTEEVKRQADKIADAFEFSDEEKGEFIKEVADEKEEK